MLQFVCGFADQYESCLCVIVHRTSSAVT